VTHVTQVEMFASESLSNIHHSIIKANGKSGLVLLSVAKEPFLMPDFEKIVNW